MKHKFLLIYSWFVYTFLFFLPDIPILMRFRGWLYGLGMKRCGKDFQVAHDATIKVLQCFEVGDHVYLANNVEVLAGGGIIIEDEVMIGPQVVFSSNDHSQKNASFRYGDRILGEIRIQRGAWVGAHCTILKNSLLSSQSILGAGSVLNKKMEQPHSLYAGVPAKFVKELS